MNVHVVAISLGQCTCLSTASASTLNFSILIVSSPYSPLEVAHQDLGISWFYLLDNLTRVPVSVRSCPSERAVLTSQAFFAERAYRMMGRSKVLACILIFLLYVNE